MDEHIYVTNIALSTFDSGKASVMDEGTVIIIIHTVNNHLIDLRQFSIPPPLLLALKQSVLFDVNLIFVAFMHDCNYHHRVNQSYSCC